MKVGVVTFPGSLDDVDAQRAVRIGGHEAVALWHGDHDLRGRRRGGAARRLLVRRLPALRRDLPLLPGDDRGDRGGGPGDAGARHLQRLPDPVRVAPAARRADPQRPPQVRLPRPAAAHREHRDRRGPRRTTRARRSRSCSRTARAGSSPTPRRSTGSRARARSWPATSTGNPNGSLRDIAGITNERGNVVGLMPHPEHAVEALTGSGTDGLGFFTSLAAADLRLRPVAGPSAADPVPRGARLDPRLRHSTRTPARSRHVSSACPSAAAPTRRAHHAGAVRGHAVLGLPGADGRGSRRRRCR